MKATRPSGRHMAVAPAKAATHVACLGLGSRFRPSTSLTPLSLAKGGNDIGCGRGGD